MNYIITGGVETSTSKVQKPILFKIWNLASSQHLGFVKFFSQSQSFFFFFFLWVYQKTLKELCQFLTRDAEGLQVTVELSVTCLRIVLITLGPEHDHKVVSAILPFPLPFLLCVSSEVIRNSWWDTGQMGYEKSPSVV